MTNVRSALEQLCKWRMIFAGWQLGTRSKDDPECQAVRDHREVTILLRAEVSALTAALVKSGVISAREFEDALLKEAQMLDKDYEKKVPGAKSSPEGMVLDQRAAEWMKAWRP